jgi:hypothetical protein
MKTNRLIATGAAVAMFTLVGCADQGQTASNRTTPTTPGQRTYDRNDINRTGRQTTAGAVEALDPSAHVSGDR